MPNREVTSGSVNINLLVNRKDWGKLRGIAISIGTPAYGCVKEAIKEWVERNGG